MVAAITQSDNGAADSLWKELGDPNTAADKVQTILREYGDASTTVPAERPRPEFSAFGQSDWSLSRQVQFLAEAACAPENQPVLDLMGQIEGDQQWGLGTITGARFKGGWGPSESGPYLVRQFGIIPVAEGKDVAVAVAVKPGSGSFSGGTADLTQIAQWLQSNLNLLPSGTCPE